MVTEVKKISRHWLGTLGNIAVMFTALAGVVMLQLRELPPRLSTTTEPLESLTEAGLNAQQAEQQEAVLLKVLKVFPSFGFDNLIADWTFLRFIQYFGDEAARQQTGYALNTNYFEVITQHDPYWVEIYPFLSTAISYYLAKPEMAIDLMDRGTTVLSPQIDPQAWRVWRYKGIDQLLLLGDIPGSIRSHEMAAQWTAGTPDEKLGPLFQQTALALSREPDNRLVRFMAWNELYYRSSDQIVRQRAEEELLKLGAKMNKTKDGKVVFSLPN